MLSMNTQQTKAHNIKKDLYLLLQDLSLFDFSTIEYVNPLSIIISSTISNSVI